LLAAKRRKRGTGCGGGCVAPRGAMETWPESERFKLTKHGPTRLGRLKGRKLGRDR
jgi:hypothetical protein